MRFLCDKGVSTKTARWLPDQGFVSEHLVDLGLSTLTDVHEQRSRTSNENYYIHFEKFTEQARIWRIAHGLKNWLSPRETEVKQEVETGNR